MAFLFWKSKKEKEEESNREQAEQVNGEDSAYESETSAGNELPGEEIEATGEDAVLTESVAVAETADASEKADGGDDAVVAENITVREDTDSSESMTVREDTDSAESTAVRDDTIAAEGVDVSEDTVIEEPSAATEEKPEQKKGFFSRLVQGLTKTRKQIVSGMDALFSRFSSIDDDFYEELEEILIMGDIGVATTEKLIEDLKQKVKENHIRKPEDCKEFLIASLKEMMDIGENAYEYENRKSVLLVIGVNGVGKTTSIGKIAWELKNRGRKVMVAAADTFRAAAIDQLRGWTNRAGVELIAQQEGSDPAAVVYDAVHAAQARNADLLICDTAGRLHNKKNLMEELRKINRIIDKEYPEAYRETILVLDGTTGQNAMMQAKQFREIADITGIIITKLDGTAKGGIAIAIQSELGIPVKYIGVGERVEDLQKFDSDTFIDALFDRGDGQKTENES